MQFKTVAVYNPQEPHSLPRQQFDNGPAQTAGPDHGYPGLEQTFLAVDSDSADVPSVSLRNFAPSQQCQRICTGHLTAPYWRKQAQAIASDKYLIKTADHPIDHQYMDFIGIDPQLGDCISRLAALRHIDGKNPPAADRACCLSVANKRTSMRI